MVPSSSAIDALLLDSGAFYFGTIAARSSSVTALQDYALLLGGLIMKHLTLLAIKVYFSALHHALDFRRSGQESTNNPAVHATKLSAATASTPTAQLVLSTQSKKERILDFLNPANQLYAVRLNVLPNYYWRKSSQVGAIKAGGGAPPDYTTNGYYPVCCQNYDQHSHIRGGICKSRW